ncbi:ZBED5 protein, partial [Amia calva]|nr:ZBED5 protein [Amia calva]
RATVNDNLLEASYLVSKRIAIAGEAHSIAENLIKPCMLDVVTVVLNETAAQKIESVPLSNSTVGRRINDIANNINSVLCSRLKSCDFFCLQLDESTDVAGLAVLLAFVCYLHNGEVQEDLFLCKSLPSFTTGEEMSNILDSFPLINFIKSKPLKARLFSIICDDMGSLHTSLLMHTAVFWLSRGKVLVTVFELRVEIICFFDTHTFNLCYRLQDVMWLQSLSYLAYVFTKINELNLGLQRKDITVFSARDKNAATKRKLECWCSSVEKGQLSCFPTLDNFLSERNLKIDSIIIIIFISWQTPLSRATYNIALKSDIILHIHGLQTIFNEYFPIETENCDWIPNPFNSTAPEFNNKDMEQYIELTCNRDLKLEFSSDNLIKFWAKVQCDFPDIATQALLKILPFATTYSEGKKYLIPC